ncbi:MAG: hypothetical protein ABIS68_12385 [Casimicrobiaceae bacterium]
MPACLHENPVADGDDQPRFLGEADEFGWTDQSLVRMAPAQQRLYADDVAGLHAHLWLITQFELLAFDCELQTRVEIEPVLDLVMDFGGEELETIATEFLRPIYCRVGMPQQRIRIAAILRIKTDTDAARRPDRPLAEQQRHRNGFEQAFDECGESALDLAGIIARHPGSGD